MTFRQLLTEFYARGFDYLNDNGVGETRAKRWINQSYTDICESDDWPFLQSSFSGACPATIADLGTVETVYNSTQNRSMVFVDRRTLTETYPDLTLEGFPAYAYITNGTTVNTYPVSTTDVIKINYWEIPTDLAADSDSPVFPARYHQAIIDYACGRAYIDSDNPEMAQVARGDADALVQLMRQRLLYQQHQDPDAIATYGFSTDGYGSSGPGTF